jgi:hypothetical protein
MTTMWVQPICSTHAAVCSHSQHQGVNHNFPYMTQVKLTTLSKANPTIVLRATGKSDIVEPGTQRHLSLPSVLYQAGCRQQHGRPSCTLLCNKLRSTLLS